jgi:hypothetical protein
MAEQQPTPEPDMAQLFDELSEKFFALRQTRMAQQKDPFGFLSDDVIMAMMETLADIANMCDMQFVKLALLQSSLSEDLKEKGVEDGQVNVGLGAFQSSSAHWKANKS